MICSISLRYEIAPNAELMNSSRFCCDFLCGWHLY